MNLQYILSVKGRGLYVHETMPVSTLIGREVNVQLYDRSPIKATVGIEQLVRLASPQTTGCNSIAIDALRKVSINSSFEIDLFQASDSTGICSIFATYRSIPDSEKGRHYNLRCS